MVLPQPDEPEQREELALADLEVDAVDGDLVAEALDQPRERERAGHQAGAPSRRVGEVVEVGDEPVDVGVGVLHRDQPLLDLAPRRQEHAAVVLDQPVRVAVAVVELEEVAEVADRGRAGTSRSPWRRR